MENSWVASATNDSIPLVLFNVPNGTGSPFTEARTLTGLVDAVLTLYLRDGNNDPIGNYPRVDMWLEVGDDIGTLSHCLSGTIAETDTRSNGETNWFNPLRAGGWSEGPTVVMISGTPLLSGDLDLRHISPDINGDLVVNLTDVSLFAGDFYGGYSFRSDFYYDGVINLSDVGKLAQAIGAACP